MGTLFALFMTALTLLIPIPHTGPVEQAHLPLAFGYLTFALLLAQVFVYALAFGPLQKAEQHLTPRILELFKNDNRLIWIHLGIIILSFTMLFAIFYPITFPIHPILCGLILLGASVDLLFWLVKIIFHYLNPYPVSKMFTKAAEKSILDSREIDLCESLESLSEISLKSLHRASSSLCNHSLDEMREIIRLFLDGTKSIAQDGPDEQAKASGITDKVSYTLFYFFDRVEMIYQKAVDLHLVQVCGSIVTMMGKICLYAARCDLSLVSYATGYVGRFCKNAERHKFPDIALKGTCTLTEVSRAIVNEVNLNYMELKDPFFSIITQLDEINKEVFRQNKQSNIPLLIAPFNDLKKIFESPKVVDHPDTPAIQNELDRVIGEWTTLETVMRTLPPLMTSDRLESENEKPTPTLDDEES